MRVGVVGAGIAGLSATKVLRSVGHDVLTFDRTPDVGGVWSTTRHYPGLTTQNTRYTYTFTDYDPPSSWPDFPSAEQWHSHIAGYVDRFGLADSLRLSTGIALAKPTDDGWILTTEAGRNHRVDHLVVANGVFSEPSIPQWRGADIHASSGGVVKAPSQRLTLDEARGRHVIVVGYGKSAGDVAVSLSEVAESLTIVARRLLWKGSKRLLGRDTEDVAQTRITETMFAHPGAFRPAWSLVRRLHMMEQQLGEVGLIPDGRFEDIGQSTSSMMSDGFVDAVRSGAIVVIRDGAIVALGTGPTAQLDDGSVIPADLVVAATGFEQDVPFLDATVNVRDEAGNFDLFRRILPHDVPNLTFCGYNSSLFSTINAEIGAVWTAAYLAGGLSLPPVEDRRKLVARELEYMKVRTKGKHARGTSVIPFSIRNIDEMLADLGVPLRRRTRLAQCGRRVLPRDYRDAIEHVLRDIGA
ncbi:MAG TPA: NAD(P)/FAD-dependent oxidoreductase [Aeromicrobium sp.]|nr:NAD(P)/FAD-dependent oxidoreductase [Aeromicrobium sp.]